jgi:hypothetical protein
MDSVIRLFKAVPIERKGKRSSKVLLEKTIEKGFIFAPEVIFNYSDSELLDLVKKVEKEIGLTKEQMNNSFHKSWTKVRDASMFQLVVEQLIHYLTTYGFERLGIYDKDTVYIPSEELEIPELKEGITLTVIKGYTKDELKEKVLTLLNQGIALSEDTIKDVVDVALFVGFEEKDIEQTRNKETKIILYDYLDKVPENPVEFLRFVVYKATEKTLLIKDKKTIESIKEKQNINALKYFSKYRDKYGLRRLAEIFFRFKPLFLAFRTNSNMKVMINKIRRLADVYHEPMKTNYLNDITAKLSRKETIYLDELKEELEKVNTFRKIRLAYALNYRTREVDSILYKIRNGKGYAKDFNFENKTEAKRIFGIVMKSIVKDLKKNVEGKRIFIPKDMVYALPATEKQFTGDFPSGTYVIIPKDMLAGIHWDNVGNHRIDLDLSLISTDTGKIGWDRSYRTEDRTILFSGDMTDAQPPLGACELFYIARQVDNALIMLVNYFNYDEGVEVPFKILIAKENLRDFGRNYTVNPNNVVCVAKSKIKERQKILGLIVVTETESRFYFSETNVGKSISSSDASYVENSRKYLFNFYTNAISLNEVLEMAGAEVVSDKSRKIDIDLSPETLEKDKIIKLFSQK